MKANRPYVMLIAWLMISCVLHAGEDHGQAGEFLRYGIGGRALGMGRAFVAVSDDASGLYWNPAGMVGAHRLEMMSMYSDLYLDSRYTYIGIVLPRPNDKLRPGLLRFLAGPSTAFGFGWVGLSMSGYEQRTEYGQYLGDFSIGENAFLVGWAREEVGGWGIFRYGWTGKLINQGFPGLVASQDMPVESGKRDWTAGLDIGMTFQPIHAPLLRLISLRYLLPFRVGVSAQNLVRPGWSGTTGGGDSFPVVLRYGVSYRWILKDWIPSSWRSMAKLLGHTQILTTFDREVYDGADQGMYFGAEGIFSMFHHKLQLMPRFGLNNRTEGTSFGIGMLIPFKPTAALKLDYAYGDHPYMYDDNRLFLTVQLGTEKGPAYFTRKARTETTPGMAARNHLLRVLAEYPNDHVDEAVEMLAELEDSVRVRRYYGLTGGLGHAEWLLMDARRLLKQGKVGAAKRKAKKAAEEYHPFFIQPEHELQDEDLLNYGEVLLILGQLQDADMVLHEVEEPSLRYYFLTGSCKKYIGDMDGAIASFSQAVRRFEQEQNYLSMVSLSFLGLGEAFIRKGQYETAQTTLQVLIRRYAYRLDADYPRYPIYADDYIIDDAQFLIGLAELKMERYADGVASLLKTQRFFPGLSYGDTVERLAENMIRALGEADWNELDEMALQLEDEYFENHQLP